MNVNFTGNVGKDAETRSTSKGDVCSFSVAVKNGVSRDADSVWMRCTIWGQRGQNLVSHITKGAKVYVTGDLTFGEYEGKTQYNVNVHDIDPFCGGKREGGDRQNDAPSHDRNLDDDVPF